MTVMFLFTWFQHAVAQLTAWTSSAWTSYWSSSKISLVEWKKLSPSRDTRVQYWYTRSHVFNRHGYTLWPTGDYGLFPPNGQARAPDGFSYMVENCVHNEYVPPRSKQILARSADGRDVVVVLLTDDLSGKVLQILYHIAKGPLSGIDCNHALPLLDVVIDGSLAFGIFPYVGSWCTDYGCKNIFSVLHFMEQILEGVVFLHEQKIAHRDLFPDNFVSSYRNGPGSDLAHRQLGLDVRYYIIDFEYAVTFCEEDIDQTVIGPPVAWDRYRREYPPEMKSDLPHCPFLLDVWQVGYTFANLFPDLEKDLPDVFKLVRRMMAANPSQRPTAEEAHSQLQLFQRAFVPMLFQTTTLAL